MITIVWVMIIAAPGAVFMPTLEFSTLEKCTVASVAYQTETAKHRVFGTSPLPFCIRIEK